MSPPTSVPCGSKKKMMPADQSAPGTAPVAVPSRRSWVRVPACVGDGESDSTIGLNHIEALDRHEICLRTVMRARPRDVSDKVAGQALLGHPARDYAASTLRVTFTANQ